MHTELIKPLGPLIKGDLHTDDLHKIIYATDASVYRELPLGVVYPKDEEDVVSIVKYCAKRKIPLIPRAGGTSLAGQCVGVGLVVDVSKYMNRLIGVDREKKRATVQPGIVRDVLNTSIKSFGLMFGPNTSTANRATIGGMVGNNSCGSTSIVFGSTRDHIKEVRAVLSDGSIVVFGQLDEEGFINKCNLQNAEGRIYQHLKSIITDEDLNDQIHSELPKATIRRRNTGYAIDELHNPDTGYLNVGRLICGSEGTLAFITEVTIGLVDVPFPHEVLIAIHFNSVDDSMIATPAIMKHQPFACELMDKTILDCTKGQRMYERDRFFIEGDPGAVMLVSFVGESKKTATDMATDLVEDLRAQSFGYSFPIITDNVSRIWNLRKAGLGLLANLPGDKKAVACIEDTAVAIDDLASYIAEFTEIMNRFGQKSVYYAHAGAGEIHLRPLLDLKQEEDRNLFFEISQASARLVKKYKGSLSGEHGDGRVRAPFIKEMYGSRIYAEFQKIKSVWDPDKIFNPGKIVDAPPMNEYLRYDINHEEKSYDTVFDFDEVGGVLRAAEKCNGSGDCRKLPVSGGTMCPSYMATRNEKDTTRARANTLREVLTRPTNKNAWESEELKEVMDLCLSCKGCTSECPSNVDMSSMKAEFLHQYQKANGIPLRSKIFGNFSKYAKLGSNFSSVANWFANSSITGPFMRSIIGVHHKRTIPKIDGRPLYKRLGALLANQKEKANKRSVYFFCDEFTNYNDADIGQKGIKLLRRLGYHVKFVVHPESGRAAISKGLLDVAVKVANENVKIFSKLLDKDHTLVGIEPSAILSFRDEYPRLVDEKLAVAAKRIAPYCLTIEEFLYQEIEKGHITEDQFSNQERQLLLHGHCHQKALSDINQVAWLLSVPRGNKVKIIPSGCCGMAGSFGYEKEHYDLSMQIGELVLMPAIRSAAKDTVIVASGTSCRHQIMDGTGVKSKHVVEVLWDCLA